MRRSFIPLAAALVGAALLLPFHSAMADQTAAPALTVSLASPAQRAWPETVPASGWLKPWQEAIIASETSGLRITDVLVDVGSVVTKGQTLVRLSQDSVLADLRKQAAAVETAKANLAKAKADADRARQLRTSGALSAQNITERLTDEQTAKASLESEEAALESQKIKLAQTTITAVDDGLITSRSAELGAVVSSGTELFHLVRQQRVEWQAEVSARYPSGGAGGLDAHITGRTRPIPQVRLVDFRSTYRPCIVYVRAFPVDATAVGLFFTAASSLRPHNRDHGSRGQVDRLPR
ncbi:efflux RND transporter periplasmic adaptor subunit [Sinorhizobium fredii]|uniref:efflux RND transporter periplasmic adaptor subunit n=1 Tax=Rhizobium fredii TaxID=380 RepID=UPI003B225BA9